MNAIFHRDSTLAVSGDHLLSADIVDAVFDVDMLILHQILVQNTLVNQETRRSVWLRFVIFRNHLAGAGVDQAGQKQNV